MMRRSTTLIAGAAVVAAMACGRSNDNNTSAAPQHDDGAPSDLNSTGTDRTASQTVTLEGCLQQGGGTFTKGYLLTLVNEPATAGTSGSVTSSGSAVEREQMRIAANTYRLEPQGEVKLDGMLGKQVRVSGTVSEQAKSPNGQGAIGSDEDRQRPNRDSSDRPDRSTYMSGSDLAKIDVSAVTITAESCGGTRSGHAGVNPQSEWGTTRAPGSTTGRNTGTETPQAGTDREPRIPPSQR
jgi:hypothetical protein